jgi:hypothetical protein
MLHITNGESAASSLRLAGLSGTVLAWQDVLHDGPVPAVHSLDELRPMRARFLAETLGADYDTTLVELAARDATLARHADHDEVVLWFEHDLYDQLQLLQILAWLAERQLGATQLSLLCIGAHPEIAPFYGLGQLSPTQLAALFPARRPVTAPVLALAQVTWAAFRAPSPATLEALLASDTSALPYLAHALTRHLEQFPAVQDGLSRSERQLLDAVAAGTRWPVPLFQASIAEEERPFLGDTTFWSYLAGLMAGPRPALALLSGESFTWPPDRGDSLAHAAFQAQEVTLTADGRAMLAGGADWIALRGGINRWLGGVHLAGTEAAWRWDRRARRLAGRA